MGGSNRVIIGGLAAVIIASAILFLIEVRPRVGVPEVFGMEFAQGQMREHDEGGMHAGHDHLEHYDGEHHEEEGHHHQEMEHHHNEV